LLIRYSKNVETITATLNIIIIVLCCIYKPNMYIMLYSHIYFYCSRPSWSYGSWIYDYLCNQYLSPLTLWVWISLLARCTQYNIMW